MTTAERSVKLRVSECKIEQVVVYQDRAEVTRSAALEPAEPGVTTLVVRGLSTRLISDSVRVKGVGRATILEVGAEMSWEAEIEPLSGSEQERHSLEEAVDAQSKKIRTAEATLERASREKELLDQYCAGSMAPCSKATAPDAARLDPTSAGKMLDFYALRRATLDASEAALRDELEVLKAELLSLRSKLSKYRAPPRRQSQAIRVRLLLHAKEPVQLFLTYQVHGAQWAPSYDARASVEAKGEMSLQLSYYGLVTNSTGEDWEDAKLALSTAQPATGGEPPALPTILIGWKEEPVVRAYANKNAMRSMRQHSRDVLEQEGACGGAPPGFRCAAPMQMQAMMMDMAPPPAPPVAAAFASVNPEANAGAARFEIDHKATILSDGAPHKVTVALIELSPETRHFSAPTLEPRAFLQARTPNVSPYPLLPSDNCSVFVDGSFVCKSSLPLTMPGEHFALFLGPDPSIKVCLYIRYLGYLSFFFVRTHPPSGPYVCIQVEVRPQVIKDATTGEGVSHIFRAASKATLTEQTIVVTNTRNDRYVHSCMYFCISVCIRASEPASER